MSIVEWKTAHTRIFAPEELCNQVSNTPPVDRQKNHPIIPARFLTRKFRNTNTLCISELQVILSNASKCPMVSATHRLQIF